MVGGGQDGGVDALYFFVNRELVEEDTELDPKTAVKVNLLITQVKEGEGFSPVAIGKLFFFTDDLLDLSRQESQHQSTYHPKLLDLVRLFKSNYKLIVGALPEIEIDYYYITKKDVEPNEDCNKAVEKVRTKVKEHFGQARCNFHFINAQRLWTQAQTRPKKTRFLKWVSQPLSTPEGEIGLVRLADYYEFLKGESGEINEKIFESNVRGFWQNTWVNKRIQITLEKPGKADFWLLNNGITILAAKTGKGGFTETAVDDPQIVNGLQTSRQIFDYFNRWQSVPTPDERRVLVRIIQTADKAIRDDVIRATNSQNPMPEEALRATDRIHRQIETLFQSHNLFYDRRKGHYKDEGKPIAQIVSVIEVLQAMLSVVLRKPDDARARPRNYVKDDKKYTSIFGEDAFELTVYLKSTQIVRRVEEFLDSLSLELVHYRNMKFYLCMYAACVKTGSAYVPPGELLKIDPSSLSPKFLQDCYDRIWKHYQRLAEKASTNGERDYDSLAKGPDLLKALEAELQKKLSKKTAAARTALSTS